MRTRLSNAQYRFLRQIETEWSNEGQADQRLSEVEPLVLARWMASPPFRRRLGKTLGALRQRRELAVTFAAARAAERLRQALERGESPGGTIVRSWLELVKLVRAREQNPLQGDPGDRSRQQHRSDQSLRWLEQAKAEYDRDENAIRVLKELQRMGAK
jgi:hypothetical protein